MLRPVQAHDHAFILYDGARDLRESLTRFTRASLESGAATIFVHAFPTNADARRFLLGADLDFERLLDQRFFLVAYAREAFEGPVGRIDIDHTTRTIDAMLARLRRRGARVFVDASHAYLDNGREEEWFAFEEQLGRTLHQRVGLVCAYRRDTVTSPTRRQRVLETHLYRLDS